MSAGSEDEGADAVGTAPCLACRATGHVISGLGGTPHQVDLSVVSGHRAPDRGHRRPGAPLRVAAGDLVVISRRPPGP